MNKFFLKAATLAVFSATLACRLVCASGFECSSEDGLQVKLFHQLNADQKWVLESLSIKDLDSGAEFTGRGDAITEKAVPGFILFSTATDGAFNAEKAVLEIPVRGLSRQLKGTNRTPELILLDQDERSVRRLTCRSLDA